MLARPVLPALKIVDAKVKNTIQFTVKGGEQVGGYVLEIYDNSDGSYVKEKKTHTLISEFIILANELANGKEYRIRLKTFNTTVLPDFSNIDDNNSSEWSDYMVLRCFSQGVVTINNIPKDEATQEYLVKNQTFTFEGSYVQKENVQLKSYRYILYDKDKVIVETYSAVYQIDGVLSQQVVGFKNQAEYYIELLTIDQYDIECTSGLIKFRVDYLPPKIQQVLKVTNDYDNALIKSEAQIIQVLIKVDGYYEFIDEAELDITTDGTRAYVDNGFELSKVWSMQFWCRGIEDNKPFLRLKCAGGELLGDIHGNRVHIYKRTSTFASHHASDVIENYDKTRPLTIFLSHEDGRINVYAQMVGV